MGSFCRIELFDGPRVTVEGRETRKFRTKKTGELLAWLALSKRPLERVDVASELWPDQDRGLARKSLTVALSSLRRILEPTSVPRNAVLRTFRDSFELVPGSFSVDYWELLDAVQRESDDQLLALLSGFSDVEASFLPGVRSVWSDEARRFAAEVLGDHAVDRIPELPFLEGIKLARAVLAVDPFSDGAAIHLVRSLHESGRQVEAVQFFKEFRKRVRDELGADPSREFLGLADRLKVKVEKSARSTPVGSSVVGNTEGQSEAEDGRRLPSTPLPVFPTPFQGRKGELELLGRSLGGRLNRVVTVTGLGGMGKTRLAVEAVGRLSHELPVLFVSFRGASKGERSAALIADRLGATPGDDPVGQLVALFKDQRVVLVLDNCETAPEDLEETMDALVLGVQDLQILATSRAPFSLSYQMHVALREVGYGVEGLESEKLFAEAVAVRRTDFQLTEGTLPVVQEICALLGGVPLALELAAGRYGALSLTQILSSLQDRLGFLKTPANQRQDRHPSVLDVIEWSFSQIDAERRDQFAALGLFGGQGPVAVVGEVLQLKEEAVEALLDEGEQLSLVRLTEDRWGRKRFEVHSLVQEFLESQPRQYMERFVHVLTEEAERLNELLTGPEQRDAHDQIALDYDNFLRAMRFGEEDLESVSPFRMAEALFRHWDNRKPLQEGVGHLTRLVESDSPGSSEKAGVFLSLAHLLARVEGSLETRERVLREGIAMREKFSPPNLVASAQAHYGAFLVQQERYEEALGCFELVQEFYTKESHPMVYAIGVSYQAMCFAKLNKPDRAAECFEETISLRKEHRHARGVAIASMDYALFCEGQGDFEKAERVVRDSLEAGLEVFDTTLLPLILSLFSRLTVAKEPGAALKCYELAKRMAEGLGNKIDEDYSASEQVSKIREDLDQADWSDWVQRLDQLDLSESASVRAVVTELTNSPEPRGAAG